MSVAPHDYSAAQKALSVHELLVMILDARKYTAGQRIVNRHILDIKDLKNVIRVNRLWFDIGSQMLWACWQSIDWLKRVPSDRQQLYASMIRNVLIEGSRLQELHCECKDVVFESLTNVSIYEYSVSFFDHMKPYLVPSLRSYSFNAPGLTSSVFTQLAEVNLDLREVSFSAPTVDATPESLLVLIRRNSSLKEVMIYSAEAEGTAASVELLSWLAKSKRLEALRLPWCWTKSASEQVAAAVSHSGVEPFSKLVELTLFASSKAFGKLAPLITKTKQLALILKDSTEDALPHLLRLRDLKSLAICYRQVCTIPVQSLMDLGALSMLSLLHLDSSERTTGSDIVKCDVSDSDCEALARRLPNLRHIRLRIACKLSTNALESFLRHCPSFSKCEISISLATTDLFNSPPGDMVFPQLKTLCLGGLSGEEITRSVCILLLSQSVAPNLWHNRLTGLFLCDVAE
jgi:hypothetical protein